ncbi:MAG: YecA family protein [Candidatus Accumulibacter sp.]|nr:YecA family protein [Accumulibacter sp.]
MNTPDPTPLDDAELDRLEALLDVPGLENAMRLDEIQGYLCAALSGPRPIDEESRLIDILGGAEALENGTGQEAAGLIRRFTEVLAASLAAGKPPTLLLYPNDEDGGGASDYSPWCHAYLAGVDQADDDWFEYIEKNDGEEAEEEAEYLDERLFPLMVLTGEAEAAAREHGETWPEGEERAAIEQECREYLAQAVSEIHRFWMDRGQRTEDREQRGNL